MCPTRVGVCVIDNAAYIALVKRWSKQRALKTWWGGMGDQDRLEWFLKQQTGQAGAKRKFDTVAYSEGSTNSRDYVSDEGVSLKRNGD